MFGILATVVLIATAALKAQATLPANCDRNATVVAGDTCNCISANHNVSSYQLAYVNAGTINQDCSNLYAGEIICLGLKGKDCRTTHVVELGDTCIQIADNYGIMMNTLFKNNPNVNPGCTNLYPDEVLCVSSTIYVNSTKSS